MAGLSYTGGLSAGHGLSSPGGLTAGGRIPAANGYFAAVVAAGGTVSPARQIIYNNLFVAIAGLPLNRLGVFAAANAFAANIDLIDPTKSVAPVSAPTFTADSGYLSTGAGSYLDIDQSASGMSHIALNNAMFGAVVIADRAAANGLLMGSNEDFHQMELAPKWSDGNNYTAINSSSNGATGPASIRGIWAVNRAAAGAFTIYLNNAVYRVATESSVAVSANDIYLLSGRNAGGDPIFNSPDTMGAYYVGGGLTAAQIGTLTTALNDYFVAVGHATFL